MRQAVLDHGIEAGPVHGDAGNAVAAKLDQIGKAILFRYLREQLPLVSDTVAFALHVIVTGETHIQKCGIVACFSVA